MSEYQYYDFVAIDRPLTAREQADLRKVSSRASISATRFSNSYSFGDLRADAAELLLRYFDAHLYLANWGTRSVCFRFPARILPLGVAQAYCAGSAASARKKDGHVMLSLSSEEEESEWIDEDDAEGELAAVLPVRAELAGGDHRALYLGWLLCLQDGELEDDDLEPPCPPGLRDLSAGLVALAEFLRLDPDLLTAAAESSPERSEPGRPEIEAWVGALGAEERDALLADLVEGAEPHLRSEVLGRVRRSVDRSGAEPPSRRTAGQLLAAGKRRRDERAREAARRRSASSSAAAGGGGGPGAGAGRARHA